MRRLFYAGFLGLLIANAFAGDAFTLDSEGYIRHWLMLAPIALPEGESGGDALFREQIKGEANLKPQAGEKVKIGAKELTWQEITATTNYFDFNVTLKSLNDHAAGYVVTYIECETEKPDVIMAVASNDEGRIYFNGVDIYAFNEPRTLMLDADKGKVTLKKGLNVIVFKVINELNSWQGAMRLLDKTGSPLKGIQIKLTPESSSK
jgi:hypothetical protein